MLLLSLPSTYAFFQEHSIRCDANHSESTSPLLRYVPFVAGNDERIQIQSQCQSAEIIIIAIDNQDNVEWNFIRFLSSDPQPKLIFDEESDMDVESAEERADLCCQHQEQTSQVISALSVQAIRLR
jgi:hypothetical protein